MKLFRICEPEFSSDYDLLSGLGAGKYGGRWNPVDTRAIYCSEHPEVSAAEAGFYRIVQHLTNYNKIPTKPARKQISKAMLINVPRTMATIELQSEPTKILDISNQDHLNNFVRGHNLGTNVTCQDLRKSNYTAIQGVKPRDIGLKAEELGYHGLKAKSARAESDIVVLFPSNLPIHLVKIAVRENVTLSARHVSGRPIFAGNLADPTGISFLRNRHRMSVDVFQF
jgi:hypothetical protein